MKRIIKSLVIASVVLTSLYSSQYEVWYEDSNHGRFGYLSREDVDKFYHPNIWKESLDRMDAYILRLPSIFLKRNHISNRDLKQIIEVLNKRDIKLVLNVLGGTLTHKSKNRLKMRKRELKAIKRLLRLGAKIDMVLFQSSFDKNRLNGKRFPPDSYPLNRRVKDIVEYALLIHSIDRGIKFGLIDALPVEGKDYKIPYKKVVQEMSTTGLRLDLILLDGPYDRIRTRFRGYSWERIKEVKKYVKTDLGIKFGKIFCDNKAGRSHSKDADRLFFLNTMKMIEEYQKKGLDKGTDVYAFMSWFKNPKHSVPEYKLYTLTYDFVRFAKQIQKGSRR